MTAYIDSIHWHVIADDGLPEDPGTYLFAFSDGDVGGYTVLQDDIEAGEVRIALDGYSAVIGEMWAHMPQHPNPAKAIQYQTMQEMERQRA